MAIVFAYVGHHQRTTAKPGAVYIDLISWRTATGSPMRAKSMTRRRSRGNPHRSSDTSTTASTRLIGYDGRARTR